jgi:pimeloyl-ACP methyl ester carboxylesterase
MEITLRDIPVYYEIHGEGRPILLLHGWSLDHLSILSSMEPVFKNRSGWLRIYLDLPGCGKTPSASWITDQDKILDIVLEFIDRVIPQEKFVLAGESAGAYLARGLVYHRFNRVGGLLMTVPLIVPDDHKRTLPPPVVLISDPQLLLELSKEDLEMLQFAVVQDRKTFNSIKQVFSITGASSDQVFLEKIRSDPARYGFSFNVDNLPEPLNAPTLILAGRQDSSVGYRDAWAILENFPRASFVVLDRAGHGLGIEQESLFTTLVNEWLDRVEEYA